MSDGSFPWFYGDEYSWHQSLIDKYNAVRTAEIDAAVRAVITAVDNIEGLGGDLALHHAALDLKRAVERPHKTLEQLVEESRK